MKRNEAGQIIGAQIISATDGSAFTGTVTVHITGDGGTQATGTVGSGVCTHEGNGFHSYAPAQGETNYEHIAFTFTGTGAVPVTVQVYTAMDANLIEVAGNAGGVAGFDQAIRSIIVGTVGSGSTTTSIVTSAITPAAGAIDCFKGLILKFDQNTTTAALRGQGTDITANTAGATPTLTVTALTTAPVSGDVFSIE